MQFTRQHPGSLVVLVVLISAASSAFAGARPVAAQPVDVKIRSADGFVLGARFYAAREAGPGVLLLHQCDRKGPETGYGSLAGALSARGFPALELDSRGFGLSRDDRYREFAEQMDEIVPKIPADVEAAFQALVAREGVDGERVAVVGASCGASHAIDLARRHESVRALVFLSGSLWPGAAEAFAEVRDRPLFVATSEGDRVTPRMQELFAASRAPASRLTIYKGDLHGAPLLDLDPRLGSSLVDWLAETLQRP